MISTPKLIGSIDREVRTLAASMEEHATRLLALYPDAGLIVRKVPDRFILQAENVCVTVSLFRSRAGMEAGAEAILAVWQGEVTLPGSTPHMDHHAVQLSVQQFRIVTGDTAVWHWMDETTAAMMTSQALAAACIETMAKQLSPVMPDHEQGADLAFR